MTWNRWTLSTMLGGVTITSLALLALLSSTEVGAACLFTAALLALAVALTGAVAQRGRDRAGWSGAVIFGGGSLLLSFGPLADRAEWNPIAPLKSYSPTSPGGSFEPRYGLFLADHVWAAWFRLVDRPGNFKKEDDVRTQWGNTERASTVMDDKDGLYLIAYDGHPPTSNEWVSPGRVRSSSRALQYFRETAHSLIALLAGLVGWFIGRSFHDRDVRLPVHN